MKLFNLSRPVIILALNTKLSLQAELLYAEALGGLPTKQVIGYWMGQSESSYVFTPKSVADRKQLVDLAKEHNQDAIMYLDQYRNSLLVPADQYDTFLYMLEEGLGIHIIAEQIGQQIKTWMKVPEHTAKEKDCYTFDPSTDSYYIAT